MEEAGGGAVEEAAEEGEEEEVELRETSLSLCLDSGNFKL